ncbi:hypothetical protein KKA53_00365 [Candidatus Dependentiae bacterium]|nr:hypothetical protein [Candidatus Dependentiae bacterium]
MSVSIYDLLGCEVTKMVESLGRNEKGNIHPLIMHEVERYVIMVVLEKTSHNYRRASRALGISRSTLYRRIEFLGIEKKK